MKYLIWQSLAATRRKLDPNYWKFTFELFGYDFIVDNDFNFWLIEVNTNPCIEESSELLKNLLRRMLEDMTKLAVDPLFPKPRIKKKKTDKPAEVKQQVSNNIAHQKNLKRINRKWKAKWKNLKSSAFVWTKDSKEWSLVPTPIHKDKWAKDDAFNKQSWFPPLLEETEPIEDDKI